MGLNGMLVRPQIVGPPPSALRLTALCILTWLAGATTTAQLNPATTAERAREAMAEQRFSDAADFYFKLAKSFPDEPSLQANLGMALHLSARDQEAVAALRKAALAMPTSFQVHFFLGASLTRLGEFGESIEPLQQATRLDPNHPFAKALLADSLEATGRFSEALAAWQGLGRVEPGNPYSHAGMARCYEQLATASLERLTRRDPESPYVLRLLGHARMAAAQYPSALFLFRQTQAREPGLRSVREAIAEIYARTGRDDWAAIERQRLATLPGVDCASSQTPACGFAAGRYEAVAQSPANPSPEDLFWAARAFSKLAEREFSSLASLPESVDQIRLIADILASRQAFSQAAEATKRALALRPGDGGLERNLAELLYRARKIDEARPLLERFLRSDPGDLKWPAMLGSLLVEQQRFEEAIPLLESALPLPDPAYATSRGLGRAYLATGRPEEAVKHLRAASRTDSDGSVHYQLAQAYQRMGRNAEAREALAAYRELEAQTRRSIEASASLEITPPE